MPVTRLTIQEFLERASTALILDVRSPGEFSHAHIPGALALPLFTDEERKIVGTAYKQESKENAIKLGLQFFGPKMVEMIETVQGFWKNHPNQNTSNQDKIPVLVHCWRGGMRSAGVAWLLDLYGFEVYTLVGGYKAYRKWVLQQFEKEHCIHILGGYTGSGKTAVLQQMQQRGAHVIDLEALAKHKGSAFGALDRIPQPSQEMFENLLAMSLNELSVKDAPIWLEDESQRIGTVNIPTPFFRSMRRQQVFFLDIPFESRLDYLVKEYGHFEKEKLVNAIIRIKKRLGGLETKTAINYLLEDNTKECFRVLLFYYDKLYRKGLQEHQQPGIEVIMLNAETVDEQANTHLLLKQSNEQHAG